MTLYQKKYRIESTRLRGWDYSSDGYYFITICVKNREPLLGHIEDGKMKPNVFGEIVQNCWYDLTNHYPNIQLDAFCIMPNHIHGIIVINNGLILGTVVETGFKPVSTDIKTSTGMTTQTDNRYGLFEFVRALKTF